MSWKYQQSTGYLWDAAGELRSVGYAGNGSDKNDPADQFVTDHGPLPVGAYTMLAPIQGTPLGPYAIPLLPDPTNVMGGRGDFFIHDDSISHPGDASDGCLVLIGEAIRQTIWDSGDHRLDVVA
jgi:Protein of unknown function (DUF2778)